jgi:formamidopyrimidine-DNA glycosylase
MVIGVEGAKDVIEVRFRDPRRFGGVFWLGCERGEEDLGPEPLTLRPGRLAKLLAKTRRAIKSALLDQRLIAGLGNIYADEALFLARIHPLIPANELTAEQAARLNRAIKQTLRGAIRHRGSTLRDYVDADNSPGGYRSKHKVYDRAGEKCRRCRRGVIERIVLTGRSTHFCPKCQAK